MTATDKAKPQPRAAAESKRSVRLIFAGSLLATLMFTAVIGYAAYSDFRFHVQVAERDLRQVAALAGTHAALEMEDLVAILTATAEDIRELGPTAPSLRTALSRRWSLAPGIGTVSVLDATGRVTTVLWDDWVWAGRLSSGREVAERDRFRPAGSREERRALLGPPIGSQDPGRLRVPIRRPVRDSQGLPVAFIEAWLAQAFFASLLPEPPRETDHVLLIHENGSILAALPRHAGWVGRSVDAGPLLLDASELASNGLFSFSERPGRAAELVASYRLADWPLTVLVLRPQAEAHAEAFQISRQHGLVLILALAGIALIGLHQLRQTNRLVAQAESLQASHEALRTSEDRLQLALDAVGAGVWDWDGQADAITLSDQHRQFIGAGPDFPASRDAWLARVAPEDRAMIEHDTDSLIAGETDRHSVEYRVRHEDGGWRWLMGWRNAQRDAYGSLFHVIGLDVDITDRKAEEQARLLHEQRFRAMFEQAGVGIGLFLANGQQKDVNDRYCQIVGYDRKWILSHSFIEFTHPDDQAISREYMERAVRGEFSSYSLEKRYVRQNGRSVWVNVTVTLLRKPDGSPDYFIGIVEDIDERKRAEQALVRAYRSLSMLSQCNEALVRASHEDELLADITRLIVDIGGYRFACVAMLDRGNVLKTRALAPDDPDLAIVKFCRTAFCPFVELKRAGAGEGWAPVILRQITTDARFQAVSGRAEELGCRSVIAVPVQVGHERLGRLLIVSAERDAFSNDEVLLLTQLASDLGFGLQSLRDSAARREAERAARENEYRVRLLLESTAEAIVGVDCEGRITFCNSAALALIDRPEPEAEAEALIGSEVHERLQVLTAEGEPVSVERCPICQAIRQGASLHRDDLQLPRTDGRPVPIEVWSHPIRPDGTLSGAVITFLDISERRAAEESYRQAQKMEAIGQLTGGIAHDFNNLLAIVVGNLEMLEERFGDDDRLAPLCRQALQAAERGSDLTSRLLAFARREPMTIERISVNDRLNDIAGLLAHTLNETIGFQVRTDPNLWVVQTDPNQMENALLNLAVNARDAMPDGGTLTIETANLHLTGPVTATGGPLPAGDYVSVTVTDTGTGMSPETIARACEPFFTTKGAKQGSGLGLAMVYGFITKAGGQLNLWSEVGKGTTVRLYLPRAANLEDKVQAGGAQEDVTKAAEMRDTGTE